MIFTVINSQSYLTICYHLSSTSIFLLRLKENHFEPNYLDVIVHCCCGWVDR